MANTNDNFLNINQNSKLEKINKTNKINLFSEIEQNNKIPNKFDESSQVKKEINPVNLEINSLKVISNDDESIEIEYNIEEIETQSDNQPNLNKYNIEKIRKIRNFDAEYKNKYYEDNYEIDEFNLDSFAEFNFDSNQEISLYEFNQSKFSDVKEPEDVFDGKNPGTPGCGNQEIPSPINFSSVDGYGHANIERAFEILKGIEISSKDPLGGNLWGLDNIGAPEVWTSTGCFPGSTGKDIVVAVCDTGIDYDHAEFKGRIVAGYDFIDNDNIAQDGHGHGTHCSGTIAGANDGVGITGVAYDSKIMPVKVLSDSGSGSTAGVIAGVRWAVDNGADVINLSLGGGGFNQSFYDAVKYACDKGVVVAMASGNDYSSRPGYPASYATDYGIAVGAVDQNRNDAGFSNRAGPTTMDYVSAPGVSVYSALPGGGYASWNGTSMATPHVAGMAALLKSYDKSLTPSQIENLICASASNSDVNSEINMFYSEEFNDVAINSNNFIKGYENIFDETSNGSDYLDWALNLIGDENQSIFIAGKEGFYDDQKRNESDELEAFVDEINQSNEVKSEEKMFIGGTEGFYDDQKRNEVISMGFKDIDNENEKYEFADNFLKSNTAVQDHYEIQNNQYVF